MDTKNRGWVLKPDRKWNGRDHEYEVEIDTEADSNYATCKETKKTITGLMVYIKGTEEAVNSGMQKIISLSTKKAELIAIVQCVQQIYITKVVES